MTQSSQLDQLVAACQWIGARGWSPATGGNMSLRQDEQTCLLSASVKDKGRLTPADFIQVEIATNRVPSGR
ncbi:class II aldolase/adducin family protein, partial [Erwinia amylovora]|uniref:class II aldolase/adducin family protein n=1 Tax=Erwinia amylovora TaxID=552 RepID=UPI0020BE67B3